MAPRVAVANAAAMRRVLVCALLACLTGCSNAPIAGLLDGIGPTRGRPDPPHGDPPPVVPDVRPRDTGGKGEPLPPPAEIGVPK